MGASTKKIGDEKLRKVIDLLDNKFYNDDGSMVLGKDEATIKVPDNLEFPRLNASVNPDWVIDRIFFVPMDRFKETNNVIQAAYEPYDQVVLPAVNEQYSEEQCVCSVDKYGIVLTDRLFSLMKANYTIIINNGLQTVLNMFAYSSKVINEKLADKFFMGGVEQALYTIYKDNFEVIPEAIFNNDDRKVNKLMINGMYEVRSYVADKMSKWLYGVITDIFALDVIDIDALTKYFNDTSGIGKLSDDAKALLESAKYSLCMQEILGIAAEDVGRCIDMTEILWVGYYFNLTDLYRHAIKNGIFDNYIVKNDK